MSVCDGQFGWSFAEPGECDFCGDSDVLVFPEPFGDRPACRPCWDLIVLDVIVFGDDE